MELEVSFVRRLQPHHDGDGAARLVRVGDDASAVPSSVLVFPGLRVLVRISANTALAAVLIPLNLRFSEQDEFLRLGLGDLKYFSR